MRRAKKIRLAAALLGGALVGSLLLAALVMFASRGAYAQSNVALYGRLHVGVDTYAATGATAAGVAAAALGEDVRGGRMAERRDANCCV